MPPVAKPRKPELARAIRLLRIDTGQSQEEMADALGQSVATVNRTEHGRRAITKPELPATAAFLGVTVEQLMGLAGWLAEHTPAVEPGSGGGEAGS